MSHQISLALTHEDIPALKASGGRVTFRPLGGGKLRCNQVPRLKGISSRQADTIRAQAFALITSPAFRNYRPTNGSGFRLVELPPEPRPPKTYELEEGGAYDCPHCQRIHGFRNVGINICEKTGRKVNVLPYQSNFM